MPQKHFSLTNLKMKRETSWGAFLAFFLPLAFFAEPLVLLYQQSDDIWILLIPITWVLVVGAIAFIGFIVTGIIAPRLLNIFFAGFAATSLISLKLLYIDFIAAAPITVVGLTWVAFFCVAFLLLRKFGHERSRPSKPVVVGVLVIFIVIPLVMSSDLTRYFLNDSSRSSRQITTEVEEQLRSIIFKEKPNIYVFVLDSLIPAQVASLFFGDGSAAYESILTETFQIPKGVTIQDSVPTHRSLGRIMWLDLNDHEDDRPRGFYGEDKSPLSVVLHTNGYHLATGSQRNFRKKPGYYVDEIIMAPMLFGRSLLCNYPRTSLRQAFRGYGVCEFFSNTFSTGPKKSANELSEKPSTWREMLRETIYEQHRSEKPRFILTYTFYPIGHVDDSYEHRNKAQRNAYREYFREKSMEARDLIFDLSNDIMSKDPNAIMIIAGDHGTYITQRSNEHSGLELIDRHGVAIAVLESKNTCVMKFSEQGLNSNASGYHTIATVILSVFECISGSSLIDNLPLKPLLPQDQVENDWERFISRHLPTGNRARLNSVD